MKPQPMKKNPVPKITTPEAVRNTNNVNKVANQISKSEDRFTADKKSEEAESSGRN